MVQKGFSPASVHARFGRSLEVYAEAIYRGGLAAAANALEVARGDIDDWMTRTETRTYDASPGYAIGDHRTETQVVADMEARRRMLLAAARRGKIYGNPQEEEGDASALDIPIPEAES